MQMEISIFMSIGNLFIINMMQPIIGRNSSRIVENQSAQGIIDTAILIDAPISLIEVALHDLLNI